MTERPLARTGRSALRRMADRGGHDRALANAILDEALVCHVGLQTGEGPRVLPMFHGRIGDQLYLHGAKRNFLLRTLADGAPVAVTATLVDGLVLARSALHHSVNYRSVTLYGTGRRVEDPAEQRDALDAMLEHVLPGRSGQTRPPDEAELAATLVVAVLIDEGSVKARTGPPAEEPGDLSLPYWGGEIPVHTRLGTPVPDAQVLPGVAAPTLAR